MIHALAIDCEFTHFDMIGGDLLSLGMVEILDDFTLGRELYVECKPTNSKYFSDKAEAVHGISYFKAQMFPDARESMINVLKFLSPLMDSFPLKTVFWGSWDFDTKWVEATMEKTSLRESFRKAMSAEKGANINALSMARRKLKHIPEAIGDNGKPTTYSLGNVAKFYGVEHDHHNALSDAKATAIIYCKMMKNENTWTGELF